MPKLPFLLVPVDGSKKDGTHVTRPGNGSTCMLTGGSGLTTCGFLTIPVGVGWMIAAGIVLLRCAGSSQ